MTIQQLKYAIDISQCGSMSKASELAFVSQPSLSASIKELETEIGFNIFTRTNRGLIITPKGNEFLAYARQLIEQYQLIEDKYIHKQNQKQIFSVSTQHYSFAVDAFINMVNNIDSQKYEFAIYEERTKEVIDDVRLMKSEIGILYINHFNDKILKRMFKDYQLEFKPLLVCNIYAYLYKGHPLANQEKVTLEQLQNYTCLSFDQGDNNSFYFSEEVLSTYSYKQLIKVNDRATMLNLMKGINGFTLCSGIISEQLNGDDHCAVPLDSTEEMTVGYIKKSSIPLSDMANKYLQEINNLQLKS